MVEIKEISNDNDDDDDDDDSREGGGETSRIQLGFSEPLVVEEKDAPEETTTTPTTSSSAAAMIVGHRSPCWWKDWDGGILGGRPSWLQPRAIPEALALTCDECSATSADEQTKKPLQFVCQLYVPLDNIPTAFHRSFYVFACPKCCRSANATVVGKGIRVLRAQLPEQNPFYPNQPATSTTELEQICKKTWNKHLPETHNVPLCKVCGFRAKGKCPVQQEWFCGKVHQREYKRYGALGDAVTTTNSTCASNPHQEQEKEDETGALIEYDSKKEIKPTNSSINNTKQKSMYLPSVYTESELVVDEEPPPGGYADKDGDSDDDDDDEDDDEIEARPAMIPASPNNYSVQVDENNDNNDDDEDSDQDLEQEDLNEMVTGGTNKSNKKDPVTDAFYKRITSRKVPEQCLRYTMDWRNQYDVPPQQDNDDDERKKTDTKDDASQPLWIRSDHQPKDIPPCPYCHAPRAFEFQLMPQMLNFLHANRKASSSSPGNNNSTNNDKKESAKQAIMTAETIISTVDPSQIPPSLVDAKANAMKVMKQELIQEDSNTVDWGVVAIYTCTKSCSGNEDTTAVTPQLGVYREEFAWVQPAMEL